MDYPDVGTATLLVRAGTGFGLRRRATSVTSGPPGWDVVELPIASQERLVDEALAHGRDIVVVEPAAARADVLARLHAIVEPERADREPVR